MLSRGQEKGGSERPIRRFGPPVELKPPPKRLRPLIALLWFACLALVLIAQGGATWRLYVFQTVTNANLASLGLSATEPETQDWRVRFNSSEASRLGVRTREVIERIDGAAVVRAPAEDVARLLAGPEGREVSIVLAPQPNSGKWGDLPRREVRLTISDKTRDQIFANQDRTFRLVSHGVDVAIALLIVVVAALLKWRRPEDPVALLLSFALLFIATLGCWRFWVWLRLEEDYVNTYLNVAWLSLLLVALPALPSGKYVPAWSRWLILLGPAAALLMLLDRDHTPRLDSTLEILVMAGSAATVLLIVVLRFMQTPQGPEKQQMKWASLGFGLGVPLACFGGYVGEVLPAELQFAARYLEFALTRTGYVMIPLGLLFSVLEIRLNDVDAAIGRSVAYVAVTTLIGVLWAVVAYLANNAIGAITQAESEILAIALSTAITIAVFAPIKSRMLNWTEARFQGALLRLRALPGRIDRWQSDDDPKRVAERALVAITRCLNAKHGALIVGDGAHPTVLAVLGTSAEAVHAALAEPMPSRRSPGTFPLRVGVGDLEGAPVTLLLGPRSYHASYSKQERRAVAAVAEPLADILDAVSRRGTHNAGLTTALTEIGGRLDRMLPAGARPEGRSG